MTTQPGGSVLLELTRQGDHGTADRQYGRVNGLVWVLASVLLQSGAAVCGKQAGLASAGRDIIFIVLNPWLAGVFICLGLQAACWVAALRRLPLSFAYPFMSLVLPINLVCSWLIFAEAISAPNVAGMGVIFLGVLVLATDPRRGEQP